MERKEVFVNESTDSPHFSDERTLRGAKPVVPLEEIRSGSIRRKLLMVLALFMATSLGAGVALLLVHFEVPVSVQSTSVKPESSNPPNSEDPSVASAGEEEEMIDVKPSDETYTETQAEGKKPRRKRVERSRNSLSDAPKPLDANNDASKKPVLVDQWQEKRSRRVTPNERGRANVQRTDLFRIRDIFEGARP